MFEVVQNISLHFKGGTVTELKAHPVILSSAISSGALYASTVHFTGHTFPRRSPLEKGAYGKSLNCSGGSFGPHPFGLS